MEPQSEKTPGLHLPQPSSGEGTPYGNYEEMPQKQEASPEIKHDATFASPLANDAANSSLQPAAADDSISASAQSKQVSSAASNDSDDVDELDKEWINKAKLIVEQTKADPYAQSQEISKVKADYLRIRYNKHIKVGQDQAL